MVVGKGSKMATIMLKHRSVVWLGATIIGLTVVTFLIFNFEQTKWLFGGATKEQLQRSVNIHGTTGRVHKLEQIRVFNGGISVDTKGSCKPYSTSNTGRKCERWIVVTTIFPPTDIMKKISSLKGWCMVVVADKKGPVKMDIPNIDYLDVVQQESCGYRICKLLPWNHFGRKNIGYLYAIEHGAKLIYDTDDDNEPLADVVPDFGVTDPQLVKTEGYVWNPYPAFGPDTKIWPRGFPLNHITDDATKKQQLSPAKADEIALVQFLAQHDPDVDAIYRLTNKLPYEFTVKPVRLVVPQKVLSPYNAQTTLHAQDAFWGMLLPVTVHGRVSDIWRSYLTQRLLWDIGKRISFHSPFVVQHRNPHNYMADFDSEMDLYYKADNLANFLLKWNSHPTSTSLQKRMFELQIKLYEFGFIEAGDVSLTEAWIQDLTCLGYVFPNVN